MSEKIKNIKDYFKKYIKHSLLSVTWKEEGVHIIYDKNKTLLQKEEKQILKLLISLGTPKEHRRTLWLLCSGAKKNMKDNPFYYKNLVLLSKEVKSLYSKQIEKDLIRSFKNKEPTEEKINQLREVLICYSIRNSSIGYCQGFNLIVVKLLEILQHEEEAFWVLTNIIEEILPLNFYSELCGVTAEQIIVCNFLEKYFPSFKIIFTSELLKNYVNNFINQSLITLFIDCLNEDTLNLVWDYFFLEGNIILIKAFIAIFGALQREIITIKNEEIENLHKLQMILSEKVKLIQNDSIYLLHCINIRQFEFSNEYLEKIRYSISNDLTETIENENVERMQVKIKTKYSVSLNEEFSKFKECNKNWPYCNNDSYFENITQVIKNLVISPRNNPEIIQNYFFSHINNNHLNVKENIFDIQLERRPHYCSEIIEEIKKERESIHNEDIKVEENEEEDNKTEFIQKLTKSILIMNKTKSFLGDFNPSPFFIPENDF